MENRETPNRTEQTVAVLEQMIAASGLGPGEPFAIEAELETMLGVSRAVVREAVSRLRALGVLDSRQGVGLIIAKPDPVGLFERAIRSGVLDSIELGELGELRYAVEIGAVELAAKRASSEQLARLAELAEELAQLHAGRPSGRVVDEIELDFHGTILQATHNKMLMRMHHVLVAFFTRIAKEVDDYPVDEATEKTVWEHRAVAEALAERNVERARALLGGHLGHLIAGRPGPTDGDGSNQEQSDEGRKPNIDRD